MGSIGIIKPLSTVLRSAVIIICNIKINFFSALRIKPGVTGCKARTLSIVYATNFLSLINDDHDVVGSNPTLSRTLSSYSLSSET